MSERREPEGDLPELPPVGRRLLAAYRRHEDIPSDAKANVWARLQQDDEGVVQPRRDHRRWLWPAVGVAAALMLWWGMRIGSEEIAADPVDRSQTEAEHRLDDSDPRPVVPTPPRRSDAAADGEVAPTRSPDDSSSVLPQPDASPPVVEHKPTDAQLEEHGTTKRRGGKRQPEGTVSPPTRPPSTLAQERALIQRAWTALAGERPGEALKLAGQHERDFPDGVLSPERAALTTAAKCKLEPSQAQALSDAFAATHPGSPLLPRVRRDCAETQ